MPELDPSMLIACAVVLAVAGFIKGVFGLALPILSVGVLSAFMPVPLVLAIVAFPIVLANLYQGFLTGNPMPTIRRFWPVILILMTVLWASAQLVVHLDDKTLYALVGFGVLLFCVTSALQKLPAIPRHAERWAGPLAASVGGFLGGVAAIWAPPLMVYFVMLRLPREEFIRTCGVVWFCASIPMVFGHFQSGVLTVETSKLSALACVPVLVSLYVGERVRRRIPQEKFDMAWLAVAFLIGLNLMRRAFF